MSDLFSKLLLGGTPRRAGISLCTRSGVPIENEQSLPPDTVARALFDRFVTTNAYQQWESRKGACGIYNCAGHVWASRRTSIYDPKVYQDVLDEEYSQVDMPSVGDLAVYRDSAKSDIFHIGMVMQLRRFEGVKSIVITPWVLSKVNDNFGEIFHSASQYSTFGHENPHVSFWTDRP